MLPIDENENEQIIRQNYQKRQLYPLHKQQQQEDEEDQHELNTHEEKSPRSSGVSMNVTLGDGADEAMKRLKKFEMMKEKKLKEAEMRRKVLNIFSF
jgi:hypothetical protein